MLVVIENMTIGHAKFRLYNRSPFLGSIIFNVEVEEDNDIKTMGSDGEKIYYNKDFWDKMSDSQKLGTLAHEVCHLFLGHSWRRGNREDMAVNPKTGDSVFLWNLAADYVVNPLISGIGLSLPDHCLFDTQYANKSTEEVYEILKKKIPKMTKQQLQDLISRLVGDDKKWKKLSGKKQKEIEQKVKGLFNQALEHQRQKGDLPSFLKRLFEEIQPKEDWRTILLDFVQPYVDDYTFNPVDRRFLDEEFVLPDVKNGEEINWLAVAIDTSGSIDEKTLNNFIGELKGIMESFDKVRVKLTFCDAEATPFIELEEYDKDKIEPKGGGGTDFRPVFEMIEKDKDEQPLALIYFTDTCGDFPTKKPDYETLWIVPDFQQQKVPFGKVLPYLIN